MRCLHTTLWMILAREEDVALAMTEAKRLLEDTSFNRRQPKETREEVEQVASPSSKLRPCAVAAVAALLVPPMLVGRATWQRAQATGKVFTAAVAPAAAPAAAVQLQA